MPTESTGKPDAVSAAALEQAAQEYLDQGWSIQQRAGTRLVLVPRHQRNVVRRVLTRVMAFLGGTSSAGLGTTSQRIVLTADTGGRVSVERGGR